MRSFWIWVARKLHAAAIADLERQDAVESLKRGYAARLQAGLQLLKELRGSSRALQEDFREAVVRIRTEDYDLLLAHISDAPGFVDNCVAHVMSNVRQAIVHEASQHDGR